MSDEELAQRLAELPDFLGGHMVLALGALLVGVALSVPLGVLVADRPRARAAVLGLAGAIQTIPGLALLALMVPLLGGTIGVWPAFMALVLYSVLPVLRNTVAGLEGVDPAMTEAARGVGMTPWQALREVRLPLAAPVILAGVRTAAVWTVGIATLSTPVGAPSLGNYIFMGLATRNTAAILWGCALSAALALTLDQLVRLLEDAARLRSRARALLGAGLLVAVVGAGFALPLIAPTSSSAVAEGASDTATTQAKTQRPQDTPTPDARAPAPRGALSIGAKPFTEQYILAQVLAGRLQGAGYTVETRSNMGSTILFDALRAGSIDAYVDYSGTIWATAMKRSDTPSREAVLIDMAAWLRAEHGIVCLGPLGFENAYALAMRRDRAQALGIASIGDLARHSGSMSIGGDYEFFGRAEFKTLQNAYGLRFARTVGLDPTLMYGAVRDGEVDVISAYSTDGRIAAFNLAVLDDPKQGFPPYDAVLLLSPKAARDRALVRALLPLINAIDNDAMRRANMRVDVEKGSVAEAARLLDPRP